MRSVYSALLGTKLSSVFAGSETLGKKLTLSEFFSLSIKCRKTHHKGVVKLKQNLPYLECSTDPATEYVHNDY